MWLDILWLTVGLAMIVAGADILVDGASSIARKAHISEFVIGLTIVGFGTSCPELVVSLTGAFEGNADISIGNVVGSNIFNALLILGLTALVSPVSMTKSNRQRDIPVALLVTLLFLAFGMSGLVITRMEGIVFLIVFAVYLYVSFKQGRQDAGDSRDEAGLRTFKTPVAILLVVCGLAALIAGGRLFVDKAVLLARALGVSDKVIAITLLAGGTSLPELATCIIATIKKEDQLALGNIIGSNIFNILLILGLSATVTPLSYASMSVTDSVVSLAGIAILWIFAYTGHKDRIDRWEGALMLALFAGYYYLLF